MRGGLDDPAVSGGRGEFRPDISVIPDAALDGDVRGTAFGELIGLSLGEFDPGSGRTLAACLTHASRGHGATRDRRTGA